MTSKPFNEQEFLEETAKYPPLYRVTAYNTGEYGVHYQLPNNLHVHTPDAPASWNAVILNLLNPKGTVINRPGMLYVHPTRLPMLRIIYRFFPVVTKQGAWLHLPRAVQDMVTLKNHCPLPITHFVHAVSDTEVGFFYSFDDLLRDKVTVMSFGRYLAKFCAHLVPDQVRDAESAYRSHMSNELHVHMGGKEIIKWYANGPSSCMVFPVSKFGTLEDHVLMTYDAPGWGIAVLYTDHTKQRASARSLVWIDPDDPSKKHYIRVYGDATLTTRLLRNGFVNKIPDRAPLKYVPVPSDPAQIVIPYFDSTNNNGGDDSGFLFMDRDRPWMLSPAVYRDMQTNKLYTPYLTRQRHNTLYHRVTKFGGLRCTHCGTTESDDWHQAHTGSVCDHCFVEQDYVYTSSFAYLHRKWLPRCQTTRIYSGAGAYFDIADADMYLISDRRVTSDPLYYKGETFYADKQTSWVKSPRNNTVSWLVEDTAKIFSLDANGQLKSTLVNVNDNAWAPVTIRQYTKLFKAEIGGCRAWYADKSLSHLVVTVGIKTVVPGLIHTNVVRSFSRPNEYIFSPKGRYTYKSFGGLIVRGSESYTYNMSSKSATESLWLVEEVNAVAAALVKTGKRDFMTALDTFYYDQPNPNIPVCYVHGTGQYRGLTCGLYSPGYARPQVEEMIREARNFNETSGNFFEGASRFQYRTCLANYYALTKAFDQLLAAKQDLEQRAEEPQKEAA